MKPAKRGFGFILSGCHPLSLARFRPSIQTLSFTVGADLKNVKKLGEPGAKRKVAWRCLPVEKARLSGALRCCSL